MATVIRRFAEVTPAPWRNGLGRTWELIDDTFAAALTPGHSWRLSVAHLVDPAPFSSFPGRQRTLIPWGGDVELEIDGDLRRVSHGEAVRFSGEARTRMIAIDTPCHALNLVTSEIDLTLALVSMGARSDGGAIGVVAEATDAAERFDVLKLTPGDTMPAQGVIVGP